MRAVHPRPLVSIVMPTHHRPDTLRRAVESVLAQTYENVELVVVNDGGCPVEPILTELDRRGRIVYVGLPVNRGMSVARNHGLRLARGEYVGFLDDDDSLDPHHVATLVEALQGSEHRVAYANSRRRIEVLENGALVVKRVDDPCPEWCQPFSADAFLFQNLMPIQSVMLHRSCIEECGAFDETLAVLEDWELWLRISRRFPFLHVERTTSTVNWRPDGITRRRGRDFVGCTRRILARYSEFAAGRPEILAAQERLLASHQRVELHQRPTCSIVVPLGREPASYVRGLLAHVQQVTRGFSTELVVLDRGLASDAAREATKAGASVVPSTLALGPALDHAAGVARGQYFVPVRPDVLLEDGWLIALVAAAEAAGGAPAIAGGKTLGADGRIEHAGLEFRRVDGTPRALFRGVEANASELELVRELEATAAAAVLVPIAVARSHGFGTIEGWACIAELCLRAAGTGTRVVLAPRSIAYRVPSKHAAPWLGAEEERALGEVARATLTARRGPESQRARSALVEGRADDVPSSLGALATAGGDAAELALLRGVDAIERGAFAEAVAALEVAIAGGAEAYAARLSLGVAYLGAERAADAFATLEPLARLHPDDEIVAHQLYQAGVAVGAWEALSVALGRYVARRPDDHEKRYALASACLRAGKREQAQQHVEELRRRAPSLVGLDALRERLHRAA